MMVFPPQYTPPIPKSAPGTFFLTDPVTASRREKQWRIGPVTTPFNRVVFSPNGKIGEYGLLEIRAGATPENIVPVVEWAGPGVGLPEGDALPAPVDVDVLTGPRRDLVIVARLLAGGDETQLLRLGVTLDDASAEAPSATDGNPAQLPDFVPVSIPVAFLSQFAAGRPDDDSRCCPTSAAMILQFWGIDLEAVQFARLSYDRRHYLYGNWSLTVAWISTFGFISWVQRHRSVAELYQHVRAGYPVIVSLCFRPGDLPGAPVTQSAGHLLVVRGFGENGDVLVNDPAGRTAATGRRTYDYASFSRAWLGHGGVALHAVPEELIV